MGSVGGRTSGRCRAGVIGDLQGTKGRGEGRQGPDGQVAALELAWCRWWRWAGSDWGEPNVRSPGEFTLQTWGAQWALPCWGRSRFCLLHLIVNCLLPAPSCFPFMSVQRLTWCPFSSLNGSYISVVSCLKVCRD